MPEYLICIDPGHAKNTAGKRSFDGTLREYEFNRAVAKRLKYHLERHGIKTMYSCDIDTAVDTALSARCKTANDANADLYVSIHANAYGSEWNSSNGWEIFICKGSIKGQKLAEAITAESIPYLGLKNRGIKDGSLYVTANTNMPAVLIEHGFYTNLEECEKLKSEYFREKCAISDAKGILKYLGVAWLSEEGAENTMPKIESGNDIVWELMNGEFKIEILEPQLAIAALEKAKSDPEICSLYWLVYKIVNRNR